MRYIVSDYATTPVRYTELEWGTLYTQRHTLNIYGEPISIKDVVVGHHIMSTRARVRYDEPMVFELPEVEAAPEREPTVHPIPAALEYAQFMVEYDEVDCLDLDF